jgi:hypothetical protein
MRSATGFEPSDKWFGEQAVFRISMGNFVSGPAHGTGLARCPSCPVCCWPERAGGVLLSNACNPAHQLDHQFARSPTDGSLPTRRRLAALPLPRCSSSSAACRWP